MNFGEKAALEPIDGWAERFDIAEVFGVWWFVLSHFLGSCVMTLVFGTRYRYRYVRVGADFACR